MSRNAVVSPLPGRGADAEGALEHGSATLIVVSLRITTNVPTRRLASRRTLLTGQARRVLDGGGRRHSGSFAGRRCRVLPASTCSTDLPPTTHRPRAPFPRVGPDAHGITAESARCAPGRRRVGPDAHVEDPRGPTGPPQTSVTRTPRGPCSAGLTAMRLAVRASTWRRCGGDRRTPRAGPVRRRPGRGRGRWPRGRRRARGRRCERGDLGVLEQHRREVGGRPR